LTFVFIPLPPPLLFCLSAPKYCKQRLLHTRSYDAWEAASAGWWTRSDWRHGFSAACRACPSRSVNFGLRLLCDVNLAMSSFRRRFSLFQFSPLKQFPLQTML